MDEGVATPPQSRTERNKTRIIAEFHIKSHFGFGDSSWITNDPSGITVKSDFRVAFFIQSPSQPLLAGVSEITPFLDYDTKKTRKDVINRACDKVRVS